MSERLTPWWVAEGLGKYAMTDELLSLRAENERLREALEPFAHFGKFCDETREDYEDNRTFSSVHITCGMMRRARAALSCGPTGSGK